MISLLSLALVGPTGAIALFQQIGNDASPATGHAAVIAQGVSFLPENGAAWRIVEDTAESLDVAVPETRTLGFTVAVNDGVLVNDYSFGVQTRVAAGEAAFVAAGASQQRASISGGNAPYLRIGLVNAAEANDAGGDTLIFAGDAFTAPDGRRDIDLVRDVLQNDEESRVGAGNGPSLVHIISGSAVLDDGQETFELSAGESAEITGEFSVRALQNDTVFIAAVVGAQVPVMPRFSGTLTLDIRACPDTVTREQLQANAANRSDAGFTDCTPVTDAWDAGMRINLNLPDGDRLRLNEADETDTDGVVVWQPLAFGEYVLGRVTEFPDGYTDYLVTDGNLGIVQRGNFTIDRNNLDPYRVIYLLQDADDEGAATVNYFYCNVDSVDAWNADDCVPMEGPVGTELIINDTPSQTIADAELLETGVYRWNDLPVAESETPASSEPGSYLIAFDTDQNTDIPDTVVTVDGAEWIEGAGAYQFTLTPAQPQATINYYLTNVNAPEESGTLRITGVACASDSQSDAECDANGEVQLPGITVTIVEGGDVLTEAIAALDGSTLVWSNIPLGLTLVVSDFNVIAPTGYTVSHIVDTDSGTSGPEVSAVLDENNTTLDFRVYLVPTAADDDADGLSNDDETNIYGTDPQDPDSDADCFSGGSEVLNFGTDPLDDTDFPANAACDVAG
jgi:hypothetical protein